MRFLFAIPHYFAFDGIGYHGSTGPDRKPRQKALAGCIGALHGLLAGPAVEPNWGAQRILPANAPRHHVDVVVVTTAGRHVLEAIGLPASTITGRRTARRWSSAMRRARSSPSASAPTTGTGSSKTI